MTNWSEYQKGVFDFFEHDFIHGSVSAVAGSGKSTTAVESVIRAGEPNTKILAFNKHIEIDFNNKLAERGELQLARTYNGFGWEVLRNNVRTKLEKNKTENILRYKVLGKTNEKLYWKFWSPVKRAVSIMKNFYIVPESKFLDDTVLTILDEFDLDIKSTDVQVFVDLVIKTFKLCVEDLSVSDFDDQKYQPIYRGMSFPKITLAVVDEYQDTCPLEGKILEAIKPNRLIVFGDSWQAIYSFKGTSKDSMKDFLVKYNAKELPLSICYRCPKEVVRHAKTIVSHIEYAPDAPEGAVETINSDKFLADCTDQDMVLARCNADLVSSVMGFIRRNVPAYVRGKEIGDQITNLLNRVTNKKNMPMIDFTPAFLDFKSSETQSLKDRNATSKLHMFEETCETIDVLSEGCSASVDIIDRIEKLFKDDDDNPIGIMHQSIHKSKGGEGIKDKDVYIVGPEKIPHPKAKDEEEEKRIHYVGITRVKGNGRLRYVRKPATK